MAVDPELPDSRSRAKQEPALQQCRKRIVTRQFHPVETRKSAPPRRYPASLLGLGIFAWKCKQERQVPEVTRP